MPGTAGRKVYKIIDVIKMINHALASHSILSGPILVSGELSNCAYYDWSYVQGREYFTIKDEDSRLDCYMDRVKYLRNFRFENGRKVIVVGRVNVIKKGDMKLIVDNIRLAGEGARMQALIKLRGRLSAEGLFDPEHKKKLPEYPYRIGVVTSANRKSQAIKDITKNARLKNPYCQITVFPARVQGAGAALNMARGIAFLDGLGLDAIVLARGGGSAEDLWEFNDESLARTIYEAETPVITGIGHEGDRTIAEDVADYRESTPTAAAVKAVFSWDEFLRNLDERKSELLRVVSEKIRGSSARLELLYARLEKGSPAAKTDSDIQSVDAMKRQMTLLMHQKISDEVSRRGSLSALLPVHINEKLSAEQTRTVMLKNLMTSEFHGILTDTENRFNVLAAKLDGLSPSARLVGGFGYIEHEGSAVSDITGLHKGDEITIRMHDGTRDAVITD